MRRRNKLLVIYEKRGKNVRELVDLMKEILMLKPEARYAVGLTSIKRKPVQVIKKPKKKVKKEVKLSDLMRRS